MRQQRINRKPPEAKPLIIDERPPPPLPEIELQETISDKPVRTVYYIEVGDLEAVRVQILVQELNKIHAGNRGGIHYVLPLRHGKIGTDIVFEAEWEAVGQEVFEFCDGKIRLKNGAQDVQIIRTKIE
jgi:hypothetical protein